MTEVMQYPQEESMGYGFNPQNRVVEGSSNAGFDVVSVMQLRLDTHPVLLMIEMFLRGIEENNYWDNQAQVFRTQWITSGVPKANKIGIQFILNYCRSMINPQTVQGNITDKDDYIEFIIEKRIEFISSLVLNFYIFEISTEADLNDITDFIMNLTELFLTRLLFNLERLSYAASMQTKETNIVGEQKKGLFGIFKK